MLFGIEVAPVEVEHVQEMTRAEQQTFHLDIGATAPAVRFERDRTRCCRCDAISERLEDRPELRQKRISAIDTVPMGLDRRTLDLPAHFAFVEGSRSDLLGPAFQNPIGMRDKATMEGISWIAPVKSSA